MFTLSLAQLFCRPTVTIGNSKLWRSGWIECAIMTEHMCTLVDAVLVGLICCFDVSNQPLLSL